MAPWDGSGNVNRTNGTNSGTTVWQDDRDDGVNIRADRHDTHDEDLANSLENTVALDGQTTTTTDNSLLWYHGTNNAFEGFEVVASRIVGRKASGDVGALTPAEGRTVLSVYSQADALAAPGASTNPSLAFNTWRTPNVNRVTLVSISSKTQTDGNSTAVIDAAVDEGGGTVGDYNLRLSTSDSNNAAGTENLVTTTFIVPPGGSYQLSNAVDPNGTNDITAHREFTL